LNKKGNAHHSSITAHINKTKSKVNSLLNHKRKLSYKKSISKQKSLTNYNLEKLKNIVKKNRSSISKKTQSSSHKISRISKKTVTKHKSIIHPKKKRIRKSHTMKKRYHR